MKEITTIVHNTKATKESIKTEITCDKILSSSETIEVFQEVINHPKDYGYDEYPEFLKLARLIINLCKEDEDAYFCFDLSPEKDDDIYVREKIYFTDVDYFYTGLLKIKDEETGEYNGTEYKGCYLINRIDKIMCFLVSDKIILPEPRME